MQTERTKDRKNRHVFNKEKTKKKDNRGGYISQRHSWLIVKEFFFQFY